MSSKEHNVSDETCESLLRSARDLIANASDMAPAYISQSAAFQDIQSLIGEFSGIKQNAHIGLIGDRNNSTMTMGETANPNSFHTDGNNESEFLEIINDFYKDWLNNHWITESQAQLMAERMSLKWKKRPRLSLFIVHSKKDDDLLSNTIKSLDKQLYKNWDLTVVSEIPCQSYAENIPETVKWVQSNDIHASLNQSMVTCTADWLALLKCGDSLPIHSLFSIADYDNLYGDKWRVIYTDEDYIDVNNDGFMPLFKPDLNVDYLRSYPYIGHFCFFRKNILLTLGAFPSETTCYNDALVLKALEYCDESTVGHIPDVLGHRCGSYDDLLADISEVEWRAVVSDHLLRRNINASVIEGLLPKTNRVVYHHLEEPLVTVIVPTKDRPDLIEPCISSLFEVTEYNNFELIIVDNGSESEDVFYYYDQWQKRYGDRIQILSYDKPFDFSAMNNHAANYAKGEYLVLLNNDTEIVNGTWMERMLMHARRDDVGVVGARLLYPEGMLQHAGVVIGLSDSASHAGGGDDFRKAGYMGRYQVDQNFSAVTAACLMTPTHIYKELGGLNEEVFKVLFNDVDYCLKAVDKGYKVVWTPYATVVHKSSASLSHIQIDKDARDRSSKECSHFLSRWRDYVRADPAYNRNLSFHRSDYVADEYFLPSWNNDFPMRPKVFALPQDYFGCGNYRICSPVKALSDELIAEVSIGPRQDIYRGAPPVPTVTDIIRLDPDVAFIQAILSEELILSVKEYKRNIDIPLVTDIDDLKTDLPDKNCNKRFISKDVRSRLRRFLANFDRLTVSTEPLALAYKDMVEEVVILPNRIDSTLWKDLDKQKQVGKKPRVGWVGAQQHHGDLEIIIDVVKATAHEIDWIFMGMCLDELKPFVAEIHDFEINFVDYPKKMASLNLDLAVAPLEIHPFNEAKSNLRLLEYGMLGWPVVCTDIYPYQNAPVKRVKNMTSEWLLAIRERIYDPAATSIEGKVLQDWVLKHWILQDHLDELAENLFIKNSDASMSRIA